MLHKTLSLTLAALVAGTFIGCKKEQVAPPAGGCVAGTVVAITCMDGPLIEVDAAYHLGAPTSVPAANGGSRRVGIHIIAMANRSEATGIDSVGQRVHFTYDDNPNSPQPPSSTCCFALDGAQSPIPRLVISNVSAIPCSVPCGTR